MASEIDQRQSTPERTRRVRTIADLADIAGVSAGTVSRALAGSHLVREETRERLVALAREHGFTPNATARNLRTQRTGAIAVIVPLGHDTRQYLSDPFFMALIARLADAISDRGYDLLLSRVIPHGPQWLRAIIDAGKADGLMIIGQSNESDVLRATAADYASMVVWGGYEADQGYCSVGTDNRLGGLMAAEHLIARGSRRIAFIGNPDALEIRHRLEGCTAAMADAGMGEAPLLCRAQLAAEAAGPTIAAWLDAIDRPPDGIVAASDIVAMSAVRALSDRGLRVPDDVRVIGYDDLPLASQTNPSLSSIAQDLDAGARALTDSLFARMGGSNTASTILPPRLILRESS